MIADGKPRPAVIVQADIFPTPTNVIICPLTSDITDTGLYRIAVQPDAVNGLRAISQIMTDRVTLIRRDRIGGAIGRLGDDDLRRLDMALALILGLTD